jgi:hTAFII28-like protein conserved region
VAPASPLPKSGVLPLLACIVMMENGTLIFSLCLMQLQQTIVGQQVNLNMTIVMCGIAKVFVGELIEAGVVGMCMHHHKSWPACSHGILTVVKW